MISLTCNHCKQVLQVDDGFAGGACRCQHCGTIQTVPSHLKQGAKPGSTGRTLYRQKTRPETATSGTGLEDLADVVASSGLGSRRLRGAPPPTGSPQQSNLRLVLIGAGVVIGALLIAVIYLATRSNSPSDDSRSTATQTPAKSDAIATPKPAAPVKPNFCGTPLTGVSVIYLLDRGDSTRDLFGDLKVACFRSIDSLGTDRKFQIIFWFNGSEDGFPAGYATYATKDNVDSARRALEDIAPHGKTEIDSAFKKAIAQNPAAIVIATAKAWELDDAFVMSIDRLREGKTTRIYTFALGDPGSSSALKQIAQKSGGEYRVLNESDFKEQ